MNDKSKDSKFTSLKPKVVLDEEMLKVLNKFYSTKLGDSCLFNECFSHPIMESHVCNLKAFLEGGKKCDHCKNIAGRKCNITCHIHHFCLIVFAYRLGVGGDDLKKALKYNSTKLSYNKLHEAVMKKMEGSMYQDGEAQDLSKLEIESAEEVEKEEEEKLKKSKEEDKKPIPEPELESIDIDGEDLITVGEAAKLYGCSYHNMYCHVFKRGNLEKIEKNGKNYVRRLDVEEMKKGKSK